MSRNLPMIMIGLKLHQLLFIVNHVYIYDKLHMCILFKEKRDHNLF